MAVRTPTRTIAARNAANRKRDPGATAVPVMSAYNGVFASSYKFPPFQNDWFLQKIGWDRVDATLNLSACRAPFNLLRYATLGPGWRVDSAIKSDTDPDFQAAKDIADALTWCLSHLVDEETGFTQDFRNVVWEMQYAWWTGYLVCEIYQRYLSDGPYAGKFGFSGFGPKINKQIGFDINPRTMAPRRVTSYTPGSVVGSMYGPPSAGQVTPGGYDFDVPLDCLMLYTHNPIGNSPYGQGTWRPCYPHAVTMDKALVQWLKAVEQWGGINGVMEVPQGSETSALDAMEGARNSGYMTIPPNCKFLLATAPSGVWQGYDMLMKSNGAAIAEAVIGSALAVHQSSNPGLGAGGEADSQTETSDAYKMGHQIGLENAINQQLVLPWCRDNYANFDERLAPKLSIGDEKPADVLSLMQSFDLGIKNGMLWSKEDWMREMAGFPLMDQEAQAGMEAEQKAQQEAAQVLADARNSGKGGSMNDGSAKASVDKLASLLLTAAEFDEWERAS